MFGINTKLLEERVIITDSNHWGLKTTKQFLQKHQINISHHVSMYVSHNFQINNNNNNGLLV